MSVSCENVPILGVVLGCMRRKVEGLHPWANETSVWREQGSVRHEDCAVQRRVCASLSAWRALRKGQVTAEGERRKRKRSGKVLYTPVHKAPAAAAPGPSNKRKKSKISLEGGK